MIAHNPGRMKTAADFLSGLKADPNAKFVPKKQEDITVRTIEVNIESTGIAPAETVFNTHDDLIEFPEQEFWQRKCDARKTTSSHSRS